MFYKTLYRAIIVLHLTLLVGCTERPDISRVEEDFSDIKSMLIPLDTSYEGCSFVKKDILTIKDHGKGDEWELFEIQVMVICNGKEKNERVRALYEYVVDFKDHAGPYWELTTWGYKRPFQK